MPIPPHSHISQLKGGRRKLGTSRLKARQNLLYGADNTQGFIYFLQNESGGPIKIGQTEWLTSRLASHQSSSPVPVRVTRAIPVDLELLDVVEKRLLTRFADCRLQGEWFTATPRLAKLARAIPDAPEPLDSLLNKVRGL